MSLIAKYPPIICTSMPGIPTVKSVKPAANEPSMRDSTRQPITWYDRTTAVSSGRDIDLDFEAMAAAAIARRVDLTMIDGSTAGAGIPKVQS